MKRTLRKYNKKSLKRSKTIKLRHKKYRGGMDSKVKKQKKKPVFKVVEKFEDEAEDAYKLATKITGSFGLPSPVPEGIIDAVVLNPKNKSKKIDKNKNPLTDLKVGQEEINKMEKPTRLNEQFIDLMEKLSGIMLKQGEPFRARAYQKAQETIMQFNDDITSPTQLKGKPGIGDTIMEKLNEYVKTGTLRILEREKENPINIIGEIYGIGPKKAKELVDSGITTIAQLREKQDQVLNDTQKIGLKYYEDILERIPRAEIDEYNAIFKTAVPSSAKYEIVGSYRRGQKTSGDIDMILTSETPSDFDTFLDRLLSKKIIGL
jgi:hypothetical protein